MKIAILGSAPSSVRLAPYGDPSWRIYGCSPGVYPIASRSEVWFELHRWEPPVLGKADQQKPWFSPEYVGWMAQHPCVYMAEPVPEIPNSKRFEWEKLVHKYGHYFFTSSIAWMMAHAMEEILEHRKTRNKDEQDVIGLWGVDMAANEEWGPQRQGCQYFVQVATGLGISVYVPPESDLLLPAPLYGICEHAPKHIKLTARHRELTQRLSAAKAQLQQVQSMVDFLQGGIDDNNYHLNTWIHEGHSFGTDFHSLFQKTQDKSVNDPIPDFGPDLELKVV